MAEDDEQLRQRNILLTERLYKQFKAEAIRRGMKIQDAFPEALEQWIAPPNDNPLLSLSADKRELAERYVDLLRTEADPEILLVLRAVLNRAETRRKKR